MDGVASARRRARMLREQARPPRHPSGCAWWRHGASSSSPSGACRPWPRSTPQRPILRYRAACLRARDVERARCGPSDMPRHADPAVRDRARRAWLTPPECYRQPSAAILYGRWPKGQSCLDYQLNSTRHFLRSSTGSHHQRDRCSGGARIPTGLRGDRAPASRWELRCASPTTSSPETQSRLATSQPDEHVHRQGDAMYRHNGGGEMLVYSASDSRFPGAAPGRAGHHGAGAVCRCAAAR